MENGRNPEQDQARLNEAIQADLLHLLANDAERVVGFIDALWLTRDHPGCDPKGSVHDAIMTAAVTVYARGFLSSRDADGNPGPTVRLRHLPSLKAGTPMRELHDRIVDARREAIAHSDAKRRATRRIQDLPHGRLRMSTLAAGWENIGEQQFRALAQAVREEAERASFDLDMALARRPISSGRTGASEERTPDADA